MKKNKIRAITECGVLIALAVVLSLIKVWPMPLGGSVTIVSMLPIFVISVRHGLGWGFASSFIYSLFQLLFGITLDGLLGWGLNGIMLFGCIVFDYIIAFTALGIAGVFRKTGERGVYLGITLACVCRFLSHFVSGYVIFKKLDQWELFGTLFSNRPILYAIAYNGMFILPELLITLAVSFALMRVPYVKKNILAPIN